MHNAAVYIIKESINPIIVEEFNTAFPVTYKTIKKSKYKIPK